MLEVGRYTHGLAILHRRHAIRTVIATVAATGSLALALVGRLELPAAAFATWQAATLPLTNLSPAPNSATNLDPTGISCSSASSCVVTGDYQDSSSSRNAYGFVETESFPITPPTTTPPSTCPTGQSGTPPNCSPQSQPSPGYIVVTFSGGVYAFGSVPSAGSILTAGDQTAGPIVGGALTANNGGYWITSSLGGVYTFGNAGFYGSCPMAESGCSKLNAPIVGIAGTVNSQGYWLVASDGGVFAFGDALFSGSAVGDNPGSPVVAIASVSNNGYWVVAANGNVYAFGTAPSLAGCQSANSGCSKLNAPIVGIQATPDGKGYWLFGADGGVFSFGDASFLGSAAGRTGGAPAV
jgi:hypothetical protein